MVWGREIDFLCGKKKIDSLGKELSLAASCVGMLIKFWKVRKPT